MNDYYVERWEKLEDRRRISVNQEDTMRFAGIPEIGIAFVDPVTPRCFYPYWPHYLPGRTTADNRPNSLSFSYNSTWGDVWNLFLVAGIKLPGLEFKTKGSKQLERTCTRGQFRTAEPEPWRVISNVRKNYFRSLYITLISIYSDTCMCKQTTLSHTYF